MPRRALRRREKHRLERVSLETALTCGEASFCRPEPFDCPAHSAYPAGHGRRETLSGCGRAGMPAPGGAEEGEHMNLHVCLLKENDCYKAG